MVFLAHAFADFFMDSFSSKISKAASELTSCGFVTFRTDSYPPRRTYPRNRKCFFLKEKILSAFPCDEHPIERIRSFQSRRRIFQFGFPIVFQLFPFDGFHSEKLQ